MNIIYLIMFFIIGSYFGTIATIVGIRLPKGEKLFKKLHCDSCSHELKIYETIPIISYIIQKGRCRHCCEKIDTLSLQMEVYSGLLFSLAYLIFGFSSELLIALGIVVLMITITVSDMKYFIIPDEVLIFFAFYFIIVQIFSIDVSTFLMKAISSAFLFLIMYLIMVLGNKILKKECLGGGDIKLMLLFGLILDPLLGIFTVFLASLLALPMSYFLMDKLEEKIIPFGPFLLMALTLVYFTKISPEMIINWLTLGS